LNKDSSDLHHHTPNVRGTPQNPMTRDEVWNIERVTDVQELRSLLRG